MKISVRIRPIQLGDTEKIVKWRNNPKVKKQLYTQSDLTLEQHNNYFQSKILTGEVKQFIIVVDDDNKELEVGTTFLKSIDNYSHKAEFGIFIGEDTSRVKGYGSQATKLTLDYGFKELGLNRVYLTVLADNSIAINAYKKVGFQLEGILKQDYKRNNTFVDVAIMGIVREDWERLVNYGTNKSNKSTN